MKNDIKIEFSRISTLKHMKLVEECICQKDFKKYVSDIPQNLEESLIICKGDMLMGFIIPCISKASGVVIAEPSLYLTYRKSFYTVKIIRKMMEYFFEDLKAERIEVRIYSSNYEMLSMMKYIDMDYEGMLPCAKIIDGESVDIYYYAMVRKNL